MWACASYAPLGLEVASASTLAEREGGRRHPGGTILQGDQRVLRQRHGARIAMVQPTADVGPDAMVHVGLQRQDVRAV